MKSLPARKKGRYARYETNRRFRPLTQPALAAIEKGGEADSGRLPNALRLR
jgi:hypothetical protein